MRFFSVQALALAADHGKDPSFGQEGNGIFFLFLYRNRIGLLGMICPGAFLQLLRRSLFAEIQGAEPADRILRKYRFPVEVVHLQIVGIRCHGRTYAGKSKHGAEQQAFCYPPFSFHHASSLFLILGKYARTLVLFTSIWSIA